MSTKTTDATNAEVGTKTQSNPPVKKAGGISRRHSLIPIALRGDNDDNYNYLASPAGKPGSADFTGKEGDGGAGTSHMNMKIIRNEEYNDNMTEEDESGKRQERQDEDDLDALLDEDDEWFEETLDRTSDGSTYNGTTSSGSSGGGKFHQRIQSVGSTRSFHHDDNNHTTGKK